MDRKIVLRGVRVHNLKGLDLELPLSRLVAICGVSGSGKSSLAIDTLFAEGQRRYLETFSVHARQFLDRLEKPDAESISGLPPAIAVAQPTRNRAARGNVATATETIDYLRGLLAQFGQIICHGCGQPVMAHSVDSVLETIAQWNPKHKMMIAFPLRQLVSDGDLLATARELGYQRLLLGDRLVSGDDPQAARLVVESAAEPLIILDRLITGETSADRLAESLEAAFSAGQGTAVVLVADETLAASRRMIEQKSWTVARFEQGVCCTRCEINYLPLEPRLLSDVSPRGACPACLGQGKRVSIDWDRVLPDHQRTLHEGAIAPWNGSEHELELATLLDWGKTHGLPPDVPIAEFTAEQMHRLKEGVPKENLVGLRGFFARLERRQNRPIVRKFLARFRAVTVCEQCHGARLRPEALAVRLGGRNLPQWLSLSVQELPGLLTAALDFASADERFAPLLEPIQRRLAYLQAVGLGYLTLDRSFRTLSRGEAQRTLLTGVLSSDLTNLLYVLDEPSAGLHPHDRGRLRDMILSLRDRGNSLVMVEHDASLIRAADEVIELGPEAGERGGFVVFQGTPAELAQSSDTATGPYLQPKATVVHPTRSRVQRGTLSLTGARGHNLRSIAVDFPLGQLCVVTGVSGAGKSSLVQQTLYPALRKLVHDDARPGLPFEQLSGVTQVEEVVLMDQTPLVRSPRSNPLTAVKAFDNLRQIFAETPDAKVQQLGPGHFSYNSRAGRCPECEGEGVKKVDMQFLPEVFVPCEFCRGTRYRGEILQVKFRSRSIAEVLDLTVREGFTFFRGHARLQAKLRKLIEVGLDYLRLGQGAQTLSGGEAQRLKLATYLQLAKRARTLFILEEPTAGLHEKDVRQMLECFDSLLGLGHSLIVVEHHLQLIAAADHIIDLGPGAGTEGGTVVVAGSPPVVAAHPHSLTGQSLRSAGYFA